MDSALNRDIEPDELKRVSVRGGLATAAAQGVRFLIRIAAQITIARLLLPSDYGLLAMVAPLTTFVALIADLGLGRAVAWRPNISHKQVSAIFWLGTAINVSLAVLVALSAPLLALIYREPRLVMLTVAAAALIPLGGLTTQHFALLTRNVRFKALAVIDIAPPLVGLIAGLAAALARWGYWSLLVAQAAETLTMVAFVWIASGWTPGPPAREPGVWSIVKVGGHLTGSSIANYVAQTADNIILGLVGGSAVLGLYDKGYRTVTQPVQQLITPFSRVAVQALLRLAGDAGRYRAAFQSMLELQLLLLVPGIVATTVICGPLFVYLLGPQWEGIQPIVFWLCLSTLGSPLNASFYWLFASQDRTGAQFRFSVVLACISVLGFVLGLPWGAAGVAAGFSLSFLFVSVPLIGFGVTRAGPVRGIDLARSLAPFAVAAIPAAGAALALRDLARLEGPWLVAAAPASYAVFLAALACMPRGRRTIVRAWRLKDQVLPRRAATAEPAAP